LDYLLHDQHRGSVGVVIALPDHYERPMPEVDLVTEAPVRDGAFERTRLGGIALHRLEPEQKTSHPVLPFRRRLGPNGKASIRHGVGRDEPLRRCGRIRSGRARVLR
jgi:hypothetical protein